MVKLVCAIALSAIFVCSPCRAAEVPSTFDFDVTVLDLGSGENVVLLQDVSRDGHVDLVAATEAEPQVVVSLGDGTGKWHTPRSFPVERRPTSLVSVDIDSDMNVDIVVAHHEVQKLSVLLGAGDGNFVTSAHSPVGTRVSPHPHFVDAGDLNGDGNVDLIVDSRDDMGVFVLRGVGGGRFDAPGVGIDVGGAPYLGFAIGDINGDARLDLVTPNRQSVRVMFAATSTQIGFTLAGSLAFASPFAVALSDMNGDGRQDLIVASTAPGENVGVFLGASQGGFNKSPDMTFQMSDGAKRIVTGDLDGDGLGDAVVSSWQSDMRVISTQKGQLQTQPMALEGLKNPWNMAIGDVNSDGRDDILVTDGVLSNANLYLSQPAPVE